MDYVAQAFATVRDATTNNNKLSTAEAIGVIELVKAELLDQSLTKLRDEVMNS